MVVRDASAPTPAPGSARTAPASAAPPGFVEVASCAQLVHVPALGHCPRGAQAVRIDLDYGGITGHMRMSQRVWPAVGLSAAALGRLPIDSLAAALR